MDEPSVVQRARAIRRLNQLILPSVQSEGPTCRSYGDQRGHGHRLEPGRLGETNRLDPDGDRVVVAVGGHQHAGLLRQRPRQRLGGA